MIRRLFEELKRRRLIAVVTWYVLATWAALQVADVLGPVLTGGDEALRFVVYAAVIGFPLALFLGWRYDFTSGGIQRTDPAEDGERTPLGGKDFLLLGLATVAFAAVITWSVRQAGQAPVVETIGAPNSVAVLRFADETGANAPLAEEISDHLVTSLIANANLAVSGRASSFYFADHPTELNRIAKLLQARHLLTGTLNGDAASPTLRVELLAMPEERALYAEDFSIDPERPWKLYAPIADQVAVAMGLTPGSGIDEVTNDEVANFLRRADMSKTPMEALQWLERAALAAPDIATVFSYLSFANQMALMRGSKPIPEAMADIRAALDRASELGADDYRYHWAEALYLRRIMRFQKSTPELEQAFTNHMDRAIALNPSDATLFVTYAIYHRLHRRYDEAGRLLRQGLERDPLHSGSRLQYSRILSAQGKSDQALEWALQLPALFDYAWEEVAARYFERGEMDRGAWWQWRWPNKNDHLQFMMSTTWMELRAPEEALETLDKVSVDSHVRPRADVHRALIEGRDEDALALALAQIRDDVPDDRQAAEISGAAWAASWLGRHELTIELIERSRPGLADPLAPEVTDETAWEAMMLAIALRELGGQEVREGILSSGILATTRNRPVMGFDGIGDRAILVHAYRGETERAVALLQEAYDQGFRKIYGGIGRLGKPYEQLLDDPEFQRLKQLIDADIDRMRENVRGWIRDGVDFVGPPPEELVQL